jgi:hypothetical protein
MIQDLIDEIEKFRVKHDLSVSEAGKRVAKDGNFVRALRTGRSPSLNTIERAKRIMRGRGG